MAPKRKQNGKSAGLGAKEYDGVESWQSGKIDAWKRVPGTAPDWCPLRQGAVTVELKE